MTKGIDTKASNNYSSVANRLLTFDHNIDAIAQMPLLELHFYEKKCWIIYKRLIKIHYATGVQRTHVRTSLHILSENFEAIIKRKTELGLHQGTVTVTVPNDAYVYECKAGV